MDKKDTYGYVLEKCYTFITDQELAKKFNVDVKSLPFKWLEVMDGETPLRGIMVEDPSKPFRRLRFFSSSASVLTEKVHEAAGQLRAEQATEVAERQRQSLGKRVRVQGDSIPTMSQLEGMMGELKENQRKAQAEKELVASLAQHMEEVEAEQREEQEAGSTGILASMPSQNLADDDDDDDDAKRAALMDVDIAGAHKKRKSGAAKAKPKTPANKRKPPQQVGVAFTTGPRSCKGGACEEDNMTVASGKPGKRIKIKSPPDQADNDGGSAGTGGGSGVSPKFKDEQHMATARHWMAKVDMCQLLAGQSYGNEIHQVRRQLLAMQKSDPHSTDVLEINAFMSLTTFTLITNLQAASLGKLAAPKREKMLKEAVDQVPQLKWPAEVQLVLVSARVKALVAEGDISSVLPVVLPWKDPEAGQTDFNPLQPTLSTCSLEDVSVAKSYLKLVVCETLIPLMLKSVDKQKLVQEAIALLQLEPPPHLETIILHAVRDTNGCLQAVNALVGHLPSKTEIGNLDLIMSSRDGTKHMLKQAIIQTPCYKSLESTLRQTQVAHTTLRPVLDERRSKLLEALERTDKIDVELLQQTCKDLPNWRQSLRSGATAEIEELFCKVCVLPCKSVQQTSLSTLVASALPFFNTANQAARHQR